MNTIQRSIAAAICCVLSFLTGCSTTGVQGVVTPERVEAVVALGTYVGAGELLKQDGARADLERAVAGLQSMKAQSKRDMVAIAVALNAAGITWLETPEGILAFGVVNSFFGDKYGPGQVLDSKYADAVLAGSIRGIQLALDRKGTRAFSPAVSDLTEEAKATRR